MQQDSRKGKRLSRPKCRGKLPRDIPADAAPGLPLPRADSDGDVEAVHAAAQAVRALPRELLGHILFDQNAPVPAGGPRSSTSEIYSMTLYQEKNDPRGIRTM